MLKKGVYEDLINKDKENEIKLTEDSGMKCNLNSTDINEMPTLLTNYYAQILKQKLNTIAENTYPEEPNKDKKVLLRKKDMIGLVNMALNNIDDDNDHHITKSNDMLAEVISSEDAVLQKESKTAVLRPLTGFSTSTLFTGGSSKVGIGEEIRREIESADEIFFIISFLRTTGVSLIYEDLKKFCQRGKKLHIITTTYCGITEEKALKRLADLPNTEIKISYNTKIERLHAKAYIFKRNSGLNTAYIGSSNLSKTAHTYGLEWNVKVTDRENPQVIKSALATFEIYWNNENFESFTRDDVEKFREEQNKEKLVSNGKWVYHKYFLMPFQKQMLDEVKMQREVNGVYRNLVVAATGTGKTVMSAFDFLSFYQKHNKNCRLLFTAHREEILKQSYKTYQNVLEDFNFGSLWVGSYAPRVESDYNSLFVSIKMFNSKFDDFFSKLPSDYYDYIVIDEAHHSQADSYRKLLDHFSPKILLGLTATPERMDGKSLLPDFNNRISSEIRLPKALQAGLLTPFLYLCVTDSVDLSGKELWTAGKYSVSGLDNVLCEEMRAKTICDAVRNYVKDDCKALCFCVTKHHADYMAEKFRSFNMNAKSLTSDTPAEDRKDVTYELRNGKINFLFVVDIFNEGVDIPEVDTVLFLRPTESLTIFLQQLGRGLRLAPGKDVLTVLDFVAQANKNYDFTSRFRALTLHPEISIAKQVKEGFTTLPFGCNIVMEKVAQDRILKNINNAIFDKRRIKKEINSYSSIPSIKDFVEGHGKDVRILYKNRSYCWTSLLRETGRLTYEDDEITKMLEKGVANLIHYNTPKFIHFLKGFSEGRNDYKKEEYHIYALMLYYDLFYVICPKLGVDDIYEALDWLHDAKYSAFMKEIGQIADYLLDTIRTKTQYLENSPFKQLELYGCYTRSDIYTMVGEQTEIQTKQGDVTGVARLENLKTILLFVTLNKSEKDFSPSTLYDDYIINENYFHWQSQNKDAHDNDNGLDYIQQAENGTKIILFVREESKDVFGFTCPFHCFGYVDYVESSGNFPMNVKWKLHEPVMPQYLNVI